MRNLLRVCFVVPQAAFVTVLLLALMISLIEFADKKLDTEKRIKLPDIYMPETILEFQRVIEKPKKPKVDKTPPPDIPEQDFDKIDGDASVGEVGTGKIRTSLDLNVGGGLDSSLLASDGEYLPIVKVAPKYPRRAIRRNIEGYVILEYTVTKQGTVRDVIVVEADPENIFNKAATKSALRYKYKPRVVDGEPVEVPGVRTRITFELED